MSEWVSEWEIDNLKLKKVQIIWKILNFEKKILENLGILE